jgi:predicted RNase H-like HicB family nuclease
MEPDAKRFFYSDPEIGDRVHAAMELPYNIVLSLTEDGVWELRLLELKGCMGTGRKFADAFTDLRYAQEQWLLECVRRRMPVPQPVEDIWA